MATRNPDCYRAVSKPTKLELSNIVCRQQGTVLIFKGDVTSRELAMGSSMDQTKTTQEADRPGRMRVHLYQTEVTR